jgi:DNA polymerase-1
MKGDGAMSSDDRTPMLYVIDGHAQFFRAYHAIRSGMSSAVTGEPTGMAFGFIGMLLKLLREHHPTHLVTVIDKAGDRGTFRSELYAEYKTNRDEPPEDFRPQVERCLQVLELLRIPVLAVERVEADDVIATLIRRMAEEHPDLPIRIVSRDKDLTQVLRDGVELFDPHKDETVTPEAIFKTEGVKPEHVIDVLALMGDTADNVPGVPGIGPKTAGKLILEYGSIDNLLAHIDEIKGKRRENIEASRDQLALSRQLVTLLDDVDFTFELSDAEVGFDDVPADDLFALMRELDFNMHRQALERLLGAEAPPETVAPSPPEEEKAKRKSDAPNDDGQGQLFGGADLEAAAAPVTIAGDVNYELVTTTKQLDALVKRLRAAKTFAVDTETDSVAPIEANLCGVSVSTESGTGAYIPVRSPNPDEHMGLEDVAPRLAPLLADEALTKVGHNLKFDINILRRHGMPVEGPIFDTMVASYVVDATRSSHRMDALSLALLDHPCVPISDLLGKGKNQITFDQVALDRAGPYAAEDADVTLRLKDVFEPQIDAMGLRTLFNDVETPLIRVLAELEFNGIHVDLDELAVQREGIAERIAELANAIADAAPHPFNPDSPKQLGVALFNKPGDDPPGLGFPVIRRGKTGPSTNQEVLEKLADDLTIDSPMPGLILEYRKLVKLVNTYLVALAEAVNPATGRVHASFNQTVASTGRLSSSDPNLQNIPIRTEIGRRIRKAFMAEAGNVLITADYSQIELRMLAHLSEDEALIDAFNRGEDIHRAVAADVFDIAPAEVTDEQRGTAKMINFGIVYGITAHGLARRLGGAVSMGEASRIIDDYKARYTGINRFLGQCVAMAKSHGYVETILKRRRAIPEIASSNAQHRALGERMAINTVVQGSAADLIKLAMLDLHDRLPGRFPQARMLLQIHDELVFEAPEPEAEAVRAFVVDRMERAMELRTPLKADSATSRTWLEAK